MTVQFGQFEASIKGILPAHAPEDIDRVLEKALKHEESEFAIIIADLKHNDIVGSDFIKFLGNPFPLRFKTLEEAKNVLNYIIELHARTVCTNDAE